MTELPQSWVSAKIPDLLAELPTGNVIDQGWSPKCENFPSNSDDTWGALRTTAIQDGHFEPQHTKQLPEHMEPRPALEVREGDLLMTCAGPRVRCGVICRVERVRPKLFISGKMYRFRPHQNVVDGNFLLGALRSPDMQLAIDQIKTGGSESGLNLTQDRFKSLSVPLPPLHEQLRIVRKLDVLSNRTAAARGHLAAIEKLVERYKLCFYLKVFSAPQEQVELGAIAKVGTGATPMKGVAKYYENGTIPWVTSGAVNHKRVTEPTNYITDAAIRETNCKVFPAGAVLMAMYGEGKTRGQVARLELDAATNQALAVIHEVDERQIDKEYLFRFLDSIYLEIRDHAEGGVQPNLNLGKVKSFKVPLPGMEEQREIVCRIETAFTKIERLAAEAERALMLTDRLDQRVLAKAIAGELVPQDPNDEPAEVLLERTRSERGAKPKVRRGRRNRAVVHGRN